MSEAGIRPPRSGLMAMRIGLEFGGPDEFAAAMDRALARGGQRGATLVAALEGGELSIHIPHEDGPSWNSVPLIHVHAGERPTDAAWREANAILERLERYR